MSRSAKDACCPSPLPHCRLPRASSTPEGSGYEVYDDTELNLTTSSRRSGCDHLGAPLSSGAKRRILSVVELAAYVSARQKPLSFDLSLMLQLASERQAAQSPAFDQVTKLVLPHYSPPLDAAPHLARTSSAVADSPGSSRPPQRAHRAAPLKPTPPFTPAHGGGSCCVRERRQKIGAHNVPPVSGRDYGVFDQPI